MDKIQDMRDYGNLDGLLQILRQDRDPELRARAARALGELGELEAADSLIGAAINDPDPAVRQAARLGLHDLLGNQADLVLRMAESSGERDANWLNPDNKPAFDQPEGEESLDESRAVVEVAPDTLADYETLRGLIMIARGDQNRELRLRATRSLGQFADMNAVRALAESALWDDDEGIRQAAEQALRERFGDQLPEFLEGYRLEYEGDEEEDAPWEGDVDPYASQPARGASWDAPQAPKFEAASSIGCLILVFLVLAAVYLIFR